MPLYILLLLYTINWSYGEGMRNIFWAMFIIVAFLAGAWFGFYYYHEILAQLYLRGWLAAPISTALPSISPTAGGATLLLQSLPEPVPLVYSETLDEPRIQEYLKQGAVVLPLGKKFGEPGNSVVTAHSSGSASFGPYRFAFARLSELEPGQEFSITTPEAMYTYKAYKKEVVWPHEVDKLPNDDRSTVTLVTCWPLWTNFKRLLVHGELIKTEHR